VTARSWALKEGGEPGPRGESPLHALQLRPSPSDADQAVRASHDTGDGRWYLTPRMVGVGDRRTGGLKVGA